MATRRIKDTRVLLTGASSGIGAALARQLADGGAKLVITARRSEPLEKLAARHPDRVWAVPGDLTDAAHRQRLIECCREKLGGLELLINNAGVGAMGPFVQASPERLRRIFEVNFFAPAELSRGCYELLKQGRSPGIMNVSSVLAHRAVPLKSEYCASKFAVHGLSDSLRAEWASDGISVLLVSPSTTDSAFFDAAIEDTTKRKWKGRSAMPPDYVARRSIRAWLRNRQELILPLSGKLLVWFDRIAPWLANRVIARFG